MQVIIIKKGQTLNTTKLDHKNNRINAHYAANSFLGSHNFQISKFRLTILYLNIDTCFWLKQVTPGRNYSAC